MTASTTSTHITVAVKLGTVDARLSRVAAMAGRGRGRGRGWNSSKTTLREPEPDTVARLVGNVGQLEQMIADHLGYVV